MAQKKPPTEEISIKEIEVKTVTIDIEGDGDLVLNKISAPASRGLLADDRKAQAVWEEQHRNKWESIITAIHWRDGIPCEDTNAECTEEMFYDMLKNNAPCITAFGLKKSWNQAVTRNEIDQYSTKFDNAVNIIAPRGLIPITFAEHSIDTRLMSPKRGAPVTTRLNHFSGWRASVTINYTEHVFKINEIATVINYAGFGIGIGSGRTSGYGRYHISDIR